MLMIYLLLIFSLLPNSAWAGDDLFFPTVISTERLMLFSFAFIVALEAWILCNKLSGLPIKKYIYVSLKANLITIFMVVPVVWGMCFYLFSHLPDFFVYLLFSTLAIDADSLLQAEWFMAPLYFIASYYVEYFFCYDAFAKFKPSAIKKTFLLANLASYLMIMFFETIYLTFNSPIEFKFW